MKGQNSSNINSQHKQRTHTPQAVCGKAYHLLERLEIA